MEKLQKSSDDLVVHHDELTMPVELRKVQQIKNMSLSELSFIVLINNYASDLKNTAYQEIQRRFKNNGCDYNAFMEYEEEAIGKRGNDIENYLIQPNPDGQLLIELYFNYVYQKDVLQHGNLLFSENLLCNSISQRTFFVKALKIELDNLNKRLQSLSATSKEYQQLLLVHQILYQRCNEKPVIWYEDSLTDCVMDIIPETSSFMSEKTKAKIEKYATNWENGSKIAMLQCLLLCMTTNSELLDYLNMHRIANSDLSKLSQQQKSIITSLKKDSDIDYSFVKEKKIEFKRY